MKSLPFRMLAGLVAVFATASVVAASGATFEVRATGVVLGEPKEAIVDGKDVVEFRVKAKVGKPFTLAAQGVVILRGGKPEPAEPDSGKWTFDEKALKKLDLEKKDDKTTMSVRVEPTQAGTTRIRYVGAVLGYTKTFDIVVEVEK